MQDNRLDKVTYMGETDFRNKRTRFGIKNIDRARHMYVIGKTGMGKSTLLENLAAQDIQNGEGICFVDPHGSSAELLLEYVPEHRIQDVMYFAPFDTDYPIAFNPLEDVDPDNRHLVASGLMSAFKKIWADAFSARMEYILSNAILALLEYPESTLLSVNRMLVEKEFRKKVVDAVTDPTVKAFWVDEYEKWDDRYRKEAGAAIQNKVGQFVSNPLIRNIVGQPKSSFDLRKMMDEKKILLINLSKGQIGEQNASLLGGMFITKLYLAAMSRADLGRDELADLPPFYFYVDEFQSFANESFADILSEARKYKLALTVAHQYVAQMPDEVREAVFGNVGSMVVYRVGPGDAEHFEREFAPTFTEQDIVNIGRFQYYLRLMIDGMGSSAFSAMGMPPLPKPPSSNKKAVIEVSRQKFADSRAAVDAYITEWYKPIPTEKDKEHNAYIEKKKAEFAAEGKEWVDFSKDGQKPPEKPFKKEGGFGQKPEYKKPFNSEYKKPEGDMSAGYKKPFIKKETPPPSPKLDELIKLIDSPDVTLVEERTPVAPVQEKKKEVSLASLSTVTNKKTLDKKASDEKVLSLKDALMKAGIGGGSPLTKPPVVQHPPEQRKEEKRDEVVAPPRQDAGPKRELTSTPRDMHVQKQVPPKEEKPFIAKEPIEKEVTVPATPVQDRQEPMTEMFKEPSTPQEERKVFIPRMEETQAPQKQEPVVESTRSFSKEVPQSAPEKKESVPAEEETSFQQTQPSSTRRYSPDELLEAILRD